LCIPKEVADTGSENDFWGFCKRNLQGFYSACRTEWQDEIFTNCMDAEVVGDGDGSGPRPSPPPAPRPVPSPLPAPVPSPSPASCVPIGDCGASSWCDQSAYALWCAGQSSSCSAPFCKAAMSPAPVPVPAPGPSSAATCVATLESYYKDASVWGPYCSNVGAAGVCPSPMCKTSTSMLAASRKHGFLGASFVQASVDAGRGLLIPEDEEEL